MILIGTIHIPRYACSVSGCTHTTLGGTSNHTGATHNNGGKCTTCGYQYENHTQSTNILRYTKTNTEHTPVYSCNHSGCTVTFNGATSSHTGATHNNEGVCTTCNYKYQNHGKPQNISRYETTETEHKAIYQCIFEGCQTIYEEPTAKHRGGTHENAGICIDCKTKYQTHEKSEEIDSYESNNSTHTPTYKCTLEECTYKYKGNAENHLGGTHKNGGQCEVCKKTYQKHEPESTVLKYQITTDEHIPIYKCTFSGCEFTHTGESKEHRLLKWNDNGNETHTAKCEDCKYEVTESHNYQNEKCTKCNSMKKENECTHTYIKKNDSSKHWEECSKCGEVKENTLKNHNFEQYTDNKNETHSSVCTECQYKLTAEHNYKDGKCKECDAIEKKSECSHIYIKKENSTQHWEECEKCGEVKAGTLKNHEFKDYKDNKDGTHSATCSECNYKLTEKHSNDSGICQYCKVNTSSNGGNNNSGNGNNGSSGNKQEQNGNNAKEPVKDNTIAKEKIPYTGKSIVLFISMIILVNLAAISIIKLRKYRDVK